MCYKVASIVKHLVSLCAFITILAFSPPVAANYVNGTKQLSAEGAAFTWEEAEARTLRIVVEFYDRGGNLRQASLGSGFLISPDGLFVTAYHVMKHCLEKQREKSNFSAEVDCSKEHPVLRYKALNRNQEFEIDIVSHLRERDSMTRASTQTPDETIKTRDFVIGRLKGAANSRFSFWKIRDFAEGSIDLANPDADFELQPLFPPKKVFVAGYPEKRDFVISHGFLNLREPNGRGYFATDLEVYPPAYLKKQGIAAGTQWGIQVENQMSGGPVVDREGFLVGLVVNGKDRTTGVLSIENVLETFLFRSTHSTGDSAVYLTPTRTELHLKTSAQKRDSAETLISKSSRE